MKKKILLLLMLSSFNYSIASEFASHSDDEHDSDTEVEGGRSRLLLRQKDIPSLTSLDATDLKKHVSKPRAGISFTSPEVKAKVETSISDLVNAVNSLTSMKRTDQQAILKILNAHKTNTVRLKASEDANARLSVEITTLERTQAEYFHLQHEVRELKSKRIALESANEDFRNALEKASDEKRILETTLEEEKREKKSIKERLAAAHTALSLRDAEGAEDGDELASVSDMDERGSVVSAATMQSSMHYGMPKSVTGGKSSSSRYGGGSRYGGSVSGDTRYNMLMIAGSVTKMPTSHITERKRDKISDRHLVQYQPAFTLPVVPPASALETFLQMESVFSHPGLHKMVRSKNPQKTIGFTDRQSFAIRTAQTVLSLSKHSRQVSSTSAIYEFFSSTGRGVVNAFLEKARTKITNAENRDFFVQSVGGFANLLMQYGYKDVEIAERSLFSTMKVPGTEEDFQLQKKEKNGSALIFGSEALAFTISFELLNAKELTSGYQEDEYQITLLSNPSGF